MMGHSHAFPVCGAAGTAWAADRVLPEPRVGERFRDEGLIDRQRRDGFEGPGLISHAPQFSADA